MATAAERSSPVRTRAISQTDYSTFSRSIRSPSAPWAIGRGCGYGGRFLTAVENLGAIDVQFSRDRGLGIYKQLRVGSACRRRPPSDRWRASQTTRSPSPFRTDVIDNSQIVIFTRSKAAGGGCGGHEFGTEIARLSDIAPDGVKVTADETTPQDERGAA
jgi:hypothetical protein